MDLIFTLWLASGLTGAWGACIIYLIKTRDVFMFALLALSPVTLMFALIMGPLALIDFADDAVGVVKKKSYCHRCCEFVDNGTCWIHNKNLEKR